MTTPIRPASLPPVAPQRSPQALAAQRAFFQTAMDRAQGAVAPVPTAAAPVTTPAASVATAARPLSSEPAPDAVSRPGRFLDIRV